MRNAIIKTLGYMVNYVVCSALLPFVLMGYQYQRNIEYLALWQVLVLCLLLSGIMIGLYYLSKAIIKSDFGAFLFVGILFGLFFTYRVLISGIRELILYLGFSSHGRLYGLFENSWFILAMYIYRCPDSYPGAKMSV